jgi:hypothetical protein
MATAAKKQQAAQELFHRVMDLSFLITLSAPGFIASGLISFL